MCKHCGRPIKSVNWYDGPGWTHEDETIGRWCRITAASPASSSVGGACGHAPFWWFRGRCAQCGCTEPAEIEP